MVRKKEKKVRLVRYIGPYWLYAALSPLLMILEVLADLCLPVLMSYIVDYGINLFIVSVGFNDGGTAPIFTLSELLSGAYFVDPVPQALTLTSIVIGACVDAMALSLVIKIYKQYKTRNADEVRGLHG